MERIDVNVNKIEQYKNVSGVWAIKGKLKDSDNWVWLNVASTKDIASEINEDLMFMKEDFENILQTQQYITKWNEKKCEYKDYEYSPRRVAVWKTIKEYINKQCDSFEVVCIIMGMNLNLGEIERKFGFKHKVLFWSDRKHYECTEKEIERRRKKYVENHVKENELKEDENFPLIYKEFLKR